MRDWRSAAETLAQQGSARTPEPRPLRLRQGVITAASPAARTATVTLGGDTTSPIPGVACLESYHPVVGDTVWVIVNGTDLLIVGSLKGSMTNYTPTLGGFTQGSGAVAGRWCYTGGLVFFEAQWTYGAGSAAAAAAPTLTLPVNADTSFLYPGDVRAVFLDSGVNAYAATALITAAGVVSCYIGGSSLVATAPTTTTPFTWGTGDVIKVAGTYVPA